MAVPDDIRMAQIANSDLDETDVFRETKSEEIARFERAKMYMEGGALEQAAITIKGLQDENLKAMALALLKNPYGKDLP